VIVVSDVSPLINPAVTEQLALLKHLYGQVLIPEAVSQELTGSNPGLPGAKVSQGMIDWFWLQGMQAGHKNALGCIKAFSEMDFTEDLKQFEVPTLILHGDDDQIVPIGASALASAKLVKHATLKVYAGAPTA
jgi:pimeloyl-ACP methyl ester carboxylesterase